MYRRIIRLVAAVSALLPLTMHAGDASAASAATFTLSNKSGLSASQAKFYYLGAAKDIDNNFIVLMPNGSWASPLKNATVWNPNGWNPNAAAGKGGKTGAGVVPCYPLNGGETVTIPSTLLSGRIYIFQADQASGFLPTACGNSPAVTGKQVVNGIFNTVFKAGSTAQDYAPFSFFSLKGSGGYAGMELSKLMSGNTPPWATVEIAGTLKGGATIDTTQVGSMAVPINITAKMTSSPGATHPQWNQGVGLSYSPNGEVNMQAAFNAYAAFAASLPKTAGTKKHPTSPRASFSALLATSQTGRQFLVNPGNYIGHINTQTTLFSNYFLNLVNNYMWQKNWTGAINTGSAYGNLPAVTFKGQFAAVNYPGYTSPLNALKFTATVNKQTVSAYVLSPVSYQALCTAKLIQGGNCSWMSPAYQIFATDGALSTPVDGNQFLMLSGPEQAVWNNYFGGSGNYSQVVARLGFIMSMAYNRGVAGGLATPGGLCADTSKYSNISECWSDQTLWYPNPQTSADKKKYFSQDTTQNQFARWLHTAAIAASPSAIPMMTQPNNPATTASGIMGMGYGFAADENPTPPYPNAKSPIVSQTPSEYSSNVSMNPSTGCNYITVMPWNGGAANPTPVAATCQ